MGCVFISREQERGFNKRWQVETTLHYSNDLMMLPTCFAVFQDARKRKPVRILRCEDRKGGTRQHAKTVKVMMCQYLQQNNLRELNVLKRKILFKI